MCLHWSKCAMCLTSASAAIGPGSVAVSRIARNFTPTAPNQVWTSDLTSLWTEEGWLYTAVVLDLFKREVVGWLLKPRMTSDIVTDALTMAWFRKRPAVGLMHHSVRGSQYASHAFQDKLTEYGMICSMSRKGNCWECELPLGERADGYLVQQLQERAGAWHSLCHSC